MTELGHTERHQEIWKPRRKWEKGKTTNYLHDPLFSFDAECLFLLINCSNRMIWHYHLHGVWSLLVLKNGNTLLVTEEASPKALELFPQLSNPRRLANPAQVFLAVVIGMTAFSGNILTKQSSSGASSPLCRRFYGHDCQMWPKMQDWAPTHRLLVIFRYSWALSCQALQTDSSDITESWRNSAPHI